MQDWREIPTADGKIQYFNIKVSFYKLNLILTILISLQTGITQYEKPGTQPAAAEANSTDKKKGGAKPATSKGKQQQSQFSSSQQADDGDGAKVISKEMQSLMEERNIRLP